MVVATKSSRLRRIDVSKVSLLLGYVLLCVMVVGLAAFFFTKSEDPDRPPAFLSPKQTTREYRTEAASLSLAPGWTWPKAPVQSVGPDGRGRVYEAGWGMQAADYFWYCSWASRVIDQGISASDRSKALKQVLSIREKYFFTTALAPNSRPVFDQLLINAELGDGSGLRRDYELNCPQGPQN
jgi:hypothetical protein